MWESHNEAAVRRHDGSGRNSPRAVYQVTEDSQSPAVSAESETLDEVIRRLLPTPTVLPPKAAPLLLDRELLIQRLLGVIRPPQPVIQERSKLTDMEIALQNLPSVVEEDGPSSEPIAESLAGCFSCGVLTHETDRCQELDESFPFLPVGWQADRIGDEFLFETWSDGGPKPTGGKRRLIRGEGLVAGISNYCGPQLPVVGEDIPGPAVSNCLEVVRSLRMVDQRTPVVGCGVQSPCSDSDESDDDFLSDGAMRPLLFATPLGGARGHDDDMRQANSLHDEWSVDSWTAVDRYGTSCAQLDNFDWVMYVQPVFCPALRRTIVCQTLSQMSGMFRTCFRFVERWRLWSRCAFLWSFRRDHRGAVIQRPWTSRVCRYCSLHGQFHGSCGKWHFSRRCRALQWMCDCSTRRGADWYISTGYTKTPYHIQHFAEG